MGIIKGRKGIFFTIIAIMLMSIVALAFAPQEHFSYKDKVTAIKSRVDLGDDYVKRLRYSYLPAVVETSGRHAMIALVQYVNKTGFLPDADSVNRTFSELMFNGSINGVMVECILDNKDLRTSVCEQTLNPAYSVTRGRTFVSKLGLIENASRDTLLIKTDFSKNFRRYEIIMYQSNESGPWKIGVNMSFNYSVDAQISSWNITEKVSIFFSIEGIPDPVYLRGSSGYINPIYSTNITVWNSTNLSQFIRDQKYRPLSEGASFTMRLYGNLSNGGNAAGQPCCTVSGSVCCGVESTINPDKMNAYLAPRSLPTINRCSRKSYIDWCFYSNICIPDNQNIPGKIWNLTGITAYSAGQVSTGYKLDTIHLGIYRVSDWATQDMGPVAC